MPERKVGYTAVRASRFSIWVVAVVAVVFLTPLLARSQSCTLGPYSSATPLATISSAINSAPDGSVVCLQRGSNWSSSATALTINNGHPDANRVLVCASTGSACSDTGGANPKFLAKSCYSLSSTSDGYTFRNLDCECTMPNTDLTSVAGPLSAGLRDVTWEGGVYRNFSLFANLGGSDASPTNPNPTNIKLGTCGHVLEFTGSHPPSRSHVAYGVCINCGFSLYVHDFNSAQPSAGMGHHLDFAAWEQGSPTDGWSRSKNIVVECGHYTSSSKTSASVGAMLKFSQGTGAIIRDNVFEKENDGDKSGNCSQGITFGPHVEADANEMWLGAEVYRNVFSMKYCDSMSTSRGSDLRIYNNVFNLDFAPGDGEAPEAIAIGADNASSTAYGNNPPNRAYIYNNTFYSNLDTQYAEHQMIQQGSGSSGHKLYNNVFIATAGPTNRSQIFRGHCSDWGTNGADIANNVVYTPNDPTPLLWSGCTAASNNSAAPYNRNPGLANPQSTTLPIVDRFKIGSGASILLGTGRSSGAPATDFLSIARPTPPSIGAFDAGSSGSSAQLEPPVLLAP